MTECVVDGITFSIRIFIVDAVAQSRGSSRPSFAWSLHPQLKEGAGKAGCRLTPTVHCAKVALQEAAQRHTGGAEHPAFPAQWFYGLCRALPGERCTIAPVAFWMTDARARSGRRITARLDAQTPGVRTTRFCRTLMAPVVCATPSLTVARPAKPFAPTPSASTAARPAFVTIAIRPSSLGRVAKCLTKIRILIKRIILALSLDHGLACFARRAAQGLVATTPIPARSAPADSARGPGPA